MDGARVIPEREVHERWCNVPEAMEISTVEWPEDPTLSCDWRGKCLHGVWVAGQGEAATKDLFCKNGHPRKMYTRVNTQGNRRCQRCQADKARLRRKNGPKSPGQEG